LGKKTKIIIIAVLVPIIFYLWPSGFGGDTIFLIVQGKSMVPTILPGSIVIVKETPPYQIDDIVAFTSRERSGQRIIVHRIIDETDRGFVIKGDNNPKKDPGYFPPRFIIGKAIFAAPYVGDVLSLLRNPVVLVITAIVMVAIQLEQGHRKKKKEKLRRIRLGITKFDIPTKQKIQKKPKKPDYKLFFVAIAFNVITYVAIKIQLASHMRVEGDALTGFFFNIFDADFASTIIFALYFVFILGLYFLAKVKEMKIYIAKTSSRKKSTSKLRLILGKDLNPMLAVASFLWLLFIILSLFHLLAMGNDLMTIFT